MLTYFVRINTSNYGNEKIPVQLVLSKSERKIFGKVLDRST